jgi:hypothetical protein
LDSNDDTAPLMSIICVASIAAQRGERENKSARELSSKLIARPGPRRSSALRPGARQQRGAAGVGGTWQRRRNARDVGLCVVEQLTHGGPAAAKPKQWCCVSSLLAVSLS